MTGYLSTQQVATLTNETPAGIAAYERRGVLAPARRGKPSQPHLWTGPHVLAIGVGRVMRAMGFRGGQCFARFVSLAN